MGEQNRNLICSVFGHKWNGCKCVRCGETAHQWNGCKCKLCGAVRNEGHDFQAVKNECSERCRICGKTRELPHIWIGCRCERCGKIRVHSCNFKPEKNACLERCSLCGKTRKLPHIWIGCKCGRCGATRDEGHDFRPEEGKCSEKCVLCGKTRPLAHQWNGYRCERCGLTVDREQEKRALERVSALRELGINTHSGPEINRVARELNSIALQGGPDAAHHANLALKDMLLCNRYIGWDIPKVASYITEQEVASDPAVVGVLKMAEKSGTDFDDAMTAQDSGVGRSV